LLGHEDPIDHVAGTTSSNGFALLDRGQPQLMEYRYEHFTVRTLLSEIRFLAGSPGPGAPFPDFDLPTVDGGRLRKADLIGRRPMFLVAASYT
jgi:hypothetical protein